MQHNTDKSKNTPVSLQALGILHIHVDDVDTVDKIALDVAPTPTHYTPGQSVMTTWYVWST